MREKAIYLLAFWARALRQVASQGNPDVLATVKPCEYSKHASAGEWQPARCHLPQPRPAYGGVRRAREQGWLGGKRPSLPPGDGKVALAVQRWSQGLFSKVSFRGLLLDPPAAFRVVQIRLGAGIKKTRSLRAVITRRRSKWRACIEFCLVTDHRALIYTDTHTVTKPETHFTSFPCYFLHY